MDIENLIESFSEFKEVKNINRETMMNILEDVFKSVLAKKYEEADNFDVIINVDKGDLEIWKNREVVADGEVENPIQQIALSEALKIEDDYEVGEEVSEQIDFGKEFGRRHVLSIRQNLAARVQDLNRDEILKKYTDRIGEIVTGEVYQVWRNEILLQDDEGNDLILPKTNQIPRDFFRKGETVKAVVLSAELRNNKAFITLSRIAPEFVERLFETEVPEVFDGLITIKKVVRIPGERAKVAVESYDDRIDPVGACVGMNGSRIHSIVRELQNENIDVINFTDNQELYISRALSPAKITSMKIDNEEKTVSVYLKPDQVSLAIGKGGQNIKLASRLLDLEIDVFRELDESQEEDVDIEEFSDEIEGWIIDELKRIGLDTAKAVLNLDKEDLIKRADLEESTIDEVISTLKKEFE